jgi:NTP pyrophosphatase (non-canonical NTP hydrolase)
MLIDLQIEKAVKHAEQKHPVFADNKYQAISIIGEEFGELAQAVNDNDFDKLERAVKNLIKKEKENGSEKR